jgi:hypothetical protein
MCDDAYAGRRREYTPDRTSFLSAALLYLSAALLNCGGLARSCACACGFRITQPLLRFASALHECGAHAIRFMGRALAVRA